MKNAHKTFEIKISSLSSKQINAKNAAIFINLNQEDEWIIIDNNSLASYKNVLIKIINNFNKKTFYAFLENSDFIVKNNVIEINTLANVNLLVSDKNNFNLSKSKEQLKEVNKNINYFKAYQNLGLELEELIKLANLETKQYQLKLKQLLYLVDYEGDIND